MSANKETSIGVKLTADLRNYQSNLVKGSAQTKKFARNIQTSMQSVTAEFGNLMRGDITALPRIFSAATAASGGFAKGLNVVKVALISTGIGAIIVGLGLAIAGVTKYFKGTEEGQIVFAKVMNKIKAYTAPIIDILGTLGKAIVQLFKGDFSGAWETAAGSIKKAGDNIKENKANLEELNALEESIIGKRRDVMQNEADMEAEIAELRNKAAEAQDSNAKQAAGYQAKAIAMTRELGKMRIDLANDEYKLALLKDKQGDNTIEETNATLELEKEAQRVKKGTETELRRMLSTQRSINEQVQQENALRELTNQQIAERADNKRFTTIETRKFEGPLNPDAPELDTSALGAMGEYMDANTEKAYNMGLAMDEAMSDQKIENMQSLSQSFGTLGSAIGGVTGHFLNMASTIIGLIPQLIAQITAMTTAQVTSSASISTAKSGEAIASGTAASQSLPFPFNIIALAVTIGSIIAALATKPPKMAAGGIVYGDTLARVGEYSGARANPEVIAPLDKLKGILGQTGEGGGVTILQPSVNFDGEKMHVMLKRVENRINKRT